MSVTAFLKARLSERSTIIQVGVLMAMGAVVVGAVTVDQIDALSGKALAVLVALGPLAGILTPDHHDAHALSDAALVEAAKLAEVRMPELVRVQKDAEAISAAIEANPALAVVADVATGKPA